MLGFVLILYFESLPTKTQLQFLSDTFLPTVKDYGGPLFEQECCYHVLSLWYNVLQCRMRRFSVKQTNL